MYRKDEEAYQDKWLDDVSKEEMKKAREAEERKQAQTATVQEENTEDLSKRLLSFLNPGETVTQCLKRKNSGLPVKRVGQKPKGPPPSEQDLQRHASLRRDIEDITGLATTLLSQGRINIYDLTKEQITK